MGKQNTRQISKEKTSGQDALITDVQGDIGVERALDGEVGYSRAKRSRIENKISQDALKSTLPDGENGKVEESIHSLDTNAKKNDEESKDSRENARARRHSRGRKESNEVLSKGKKRGAGKNASSYYMSLLDASRVSGVPLSSFKKLKYAYPSLKENIFGNNDLNSKEIPPTCPENTGFYNGKRINIASRFENGTFICYNTHSCISCFDGNNFCVVVGLKGSCEPFNIFESREGPSEILVLDKNLDAINRMTFSFGDIADLKMRGECLFVLFRNGTLAKIECLDQSKLTIINSIGKVTKFDANSIMCVYTNGNELRNSQGQSKLYDGVIIDLAISERLVFTLDINGRIVQSALDFTNPKELSCKYTFNKITFIDGLLIAIEDDVKLHTVFFPDDPDGKHGSFVSYFLGFFDGTVSNFKRYRGKRRCRRMFQVIKREDGVVFCTDEHDFSRGERLHIPAVKDFGDNFMFATENGLILKVFYE